MLSPYAKHNQNKTYLCCTMKGILEIYRYTFKYKGKALMVILCNLLFVIFNLISLALFVPFLNIIFKQTDSEELKEHLIEPVYNGGFTDFFTYIIDLFNFKMHSIASVDPKGALLFVCISVVIAFILKNFFRYGAIYFQSDLRMSVVRDVRDKLFAKAMKLPVSFYTDEKKGDLTARMQSDVNEIEVAVIAVLELVFREPLAIIINLSVLLYWSPQLTLFSLILLPITALIIALVGKSLKRTARNEKHQMGVVFSVIDEYLGGIKIIKAFNAGDMVTESFRKENLKHQKYVTKSFRKKDLSSPLNETFGAIVMISIVWLGGSIILDPTPSSNFTGEEFMGFIIVFSQLLRPIQNIAKSIADLNKSSASQDRINETLNTDEKIYQVENPISIQSFDGKIEFKNVFFKYKDENVLKNINFEINNGQSVALVGESGSGKSTLADLLPRFHDVTEGEICIDGINIKETSLFDLREHIGIVSQESILFNASVLENIAFGKSDATREEIIRAAKIANADKFIVQLEDGYDTNIGERGNKLSGGQKQRISIARAILKNPSILILDEATSALDTESEKLVQEALDNLMKDRTSLVIAHRLSTIKKADKIIVLSKGEIVETGTHASLMELKGIYYKLSTLQGISQ